MVSLCAENNIDQKQMREYYSETLIRMIKSDKSIIALDADLLRAIGLLPYRDSYPDNIIDCGIAEGNMMGIATGLSSEGFVPFAHSFAPFASRRAYDQIFMSGAYAKLNVKVVGSDPGVASELNGGTHQSNEDIALMRAIPGMTVVDVADSVMLREILPVIASTYGMFYLRLPRRAMPQVYREGSSFELGKAVRLREGNDITIIASGIEVPEALRAANTLHAKGLEARVLDMFTIKPIDEEAVLAAAAETGAIVTAENHSVIGGLGSAVAQVVSANDPVPVGYIGIQDVFGEVGTMPQLMQKFMLTEEHIVAKALSVLEKKR